MLFRQLKKSKSGNPNGLPLPPGPKGYPLIGNAFDMPLQNSWLVYEEWCTTYGKPFMINSPPRRILFDNWTFLLGDMVYFSVLGRHFLILGSHQRTADLLEKRSSNYSDRMRMPMVMELYVSDSCHFNVFVKQNFIHCRMGWDFNMAFMPYGLWWRKHRKSMHEYFHANAVSKYLPIQKREVHACLRRILATPDKFLHHIEQ